MLLPPARPRGCRLATGAASACPQRRGWGWQMAPHQARAGEAAAHLGRAFGTGMAATEEEVRLYFVPHYWKLARYMGAEDPALFERAFLEGYRAGARRAG